MLAADAGRALALGSVAIWLALGRPPLAWLAITSFVEGSLFVFFQLSEGAALPQIVPKEQLAAGDRAEPGPHAGCRARRQPTRRRALRPLAAASIRSRRGLVRVSFVSLLFIRPALQGERERPGARCGTRSARGRLAAPATVHARDHRLRGRDELRPPGPVARPDRAAPEPRSLVGADRRRLRDHRGRVDRRSARGTVGAAARPAADRRARLAVDLAGADRCALPARQPGRDRDHHRVRLHRGPVFNVVVGAYRYALVPERLYGRVASATLLFAWGSIPLGSLFAGYGIAAWGARPMLLILAAILLVIALAATASRDLRKARRPEELALASMEA
jgi:hypothetical protein